MGDGKSDVLQGTLDLMVLKTLESMGSLHGYAIARRIEQVSDHTVIMNHGDYLPGAATPTAAQVDQGRVGHL